MRLHAMLLAGGMIAAALLSPSLAASQTVALHHGDADPVTEGWTKFFEGTSGPVLDGPTPAWFMHGSVFYRQILSTTQRQEVGDDFVITAILRIVDPSVSTPESGVYFVYGSGYAFSILCGRRSTGEAFVKLVAFEPYSNPPGPSGPEYTITDGQEAYHRLDLVCADGVGDLYVDGVLRIANHPGYVTANPLGWLSFHNGEFVGQTRFHHAELRRGQDLPVPAEPASWGAIKALYRAADGS